MVTKSTTCKRRPVTSSLGLEWTADTSTQEMISLPRDSTRRKTTRVSPDKSSRQWPCNAVSWHIAIIEAVATYHRIAHCTHRSDELLTRGGRIDGYKKDRNNHCTVSIIDYLHAFTSPSQPSPHPTTSAFPPAKKALLPRPPRLTPRAHTLHPHRLCHNVHVQLRRRRHRQPTYRPHLRYVDAGALQQRSRWLQEHVRPRRLHSREFVCARVQRFLRRRRLLRQC